MYPKRYPLWSQAIVLIVCLTLSFVSFRLVHRVAQSRSHENFQVLTNQGLASLDRRFEEYRRTLESTAALFLSSDQVTAAEMSHYGESLGIGDYLLGIDAIGFAESAPAGDVTSVPDPSDDSLYANILARSDAQSEHFVVRYIEPQAGNEALMGLDLHSNPELISAAKTARDTYKTLMAMHVRPPGAPDRQPQAMVLKPIYRAARPPLTPDAPQEEFLGFALAVINLGKAFDGLTSAQDHLIELTVEETHPDLTWPTETRASDAAATGSLPTYVLVEEFQKFGRTLTLKWHGTPRFEQVQPFRARWIVLALGLLVTTLVSVILHVLIRRERTIAAIVEQKSRDLETRDKEQRSILGNAMLAIISVKPSGEILHSNAAAQKLLGQPTSAAHLPAMMLGQLLPTLDLDRPDGRFKLQLPPNLTKADPSIIEVEKNSWLTSDGQTRLTLLLRDITVSESHAQEIAKTEQRWNLALMGAHIGVFDVDLKAQTSVVSDLWRATMQIDIPADCDDPYRTKMDRIHPDDLALLTQAEAACIEGSAERAEAQFRVMLSDGEWRWIQSDAVVVERAADGTALRMLGTQMDITERVKLNQIKRDFVATVSHELRTPLTSIQGALGLLKARLEDPQPDAVERLMQIALSNSDRLVSLVNDILDMEKINSGSMNHICQVESLNHILGLASEQVGTYALQWRVRLEVAAPGSEQNIWTDKKRAIQVLTNLLSNACKFAHPDTTVRLTAEILPSYARISVSNLGPGIPDEFRNKVFQPFSQADTSDTRQRGGTGLGLNISRQLIEAMGGTIGFDSEPGKQTVFWFTCPLADRFENSHLS